MVGFKTLPKLCALVALGLPSIATSTEVAQEQPKKESFLSRFFGKRDEPSTRPEEINQADTTETQEHSETGEPPRYSVDWYLLPKPENREQLRDELPCYLAQCVPEDCNEPILPVVEKRIKKFLSLSEKDQRLLRLHSYCLGS